METVYTTRCPTKTQYGGGALTSIYFWALGVAITRRARGGVQGPGRDMKVITQAQKALGD